MQGILEDEGLLVEVAGDAQEALAGAARHPPKLVVLDITLPGVDGYEVARQLRARHGTEKSMLKITRLVLIGLLFFSFLSAAAEEKKSPVASNASSRVTGRSR